MQRRLSTPRLARAATGLSAPEFEALLQTFDALWQKPLRRRTAQDAARQRQPGGGRTGLLAGSRLKLAFIPFYFRVYPTQDVLGLFFDLSQPQVCAWVHRLTPRLQEALAMNSICPNASQPACTRCWPNAPNWPSSSMAPNGPCAARGPNRPKASTTAGPQNPHLEECSPRGGEKSPGVERDSARARA